MPEDLNVPDVYCDQFSFTQSPYGVSLTFMLSSSNPPAIPSQSSGKPQVVVRMSLEHMKVMAMLIRKRLKQYELEHLGDPIRVPAQVLKGLDLAETDW